MAKSLAEIKKNIVNTPELPYYQIAAILNPFVHFAFVGGVASGKTFVGVHWVLRMLMENPGKNGFIGANTFDQLSTATLQELFLWFNEYGIDYVSDKQPPKEWKAPKRFKSYENVISVRYKIKKKEYISYIFTRVMSGANNLRGITITWAWMDEIAFAPEAAHNVVLSRLRQTKGYFRTLVTTTTNGENWFWKRFFKNPSPLYRTMHVKTIESVKAGIISQEFYDSLRSSYSVNLAIQELDAGYVNALEGRTYYAAAKANEAPLCPWNGLTRPDPAYPLELSCDFNYSPAPMVWCLSQRSPCGKKLHVFKEFSAVECSTERMAQTIANFYGNFHIRVYGDSSGTHGTTSNAGMTDYKIIANIFAKANIVYSINTEKANPLVRDRTENVNRMLLNGMNEISLTYNPALCPLLHADFTKVGWNKASGKLTGNGDHTLTHASDGLGYLIWKLFPPLARGTEISKLQGNHRQDINQAV